MTTPAIPQPSKRVTRFESLAAGLFIHYGLYSQMGAGEWIQHFREIPTDEYAKLADTFDAKQFDGGAIAALAKRAGMRYACLTTRHHDGFSLYDTRGLDRFDAPRSAAKRDLVAEFVDGCRDNGVIPFFYHTTLDWRWDTANCDTGKFDEYLDYLNASIEILCSNYGPIGGLWFDGNWSRPDADWKEDALYTTIRRLQPEAMIVNNTGLNLRGATGHNEIDSVTFEQGLPSAPDRTGQPKYLAGEMCETLNDHWGIGRQDYRFKSPATIIENLCACRKVGANYLVNVGPRGDGSIGAYESALLEIVGEWASNFGDLIYEGRPVSATCPGRDFLLTSKGRFYYFAFNLTRTGSSHVVVSSGGNGPRSITGFPHQVVGATWLDNQSEIAFVQSADRSLLTIDCSGYDYGYNLVVRVAEIVVDDS